jgi:FkbM family methyltransferase
MRSVQLRRVLRPFIPKPVLRYRQLLAPRRIAAHKGLELIARDLFFDLKRGEKVLRIASAHQIYLQHMIENFDYYIDAVIPLNVNGTQLVDMSGPRYHRLKGFADIPFLFPSQTEPYDTTAEYLDFAALKSGETVLDIGAYAGVTSIIFAQLVGSRGRVIAFEADRTNYECAQINLEMAARVMGLRNITLFRKAIWSQTGGLRFSNEGAMGSSAVAITGGNRGDEQIVDSIRLEDFFKEYKLHHADFVKIDIEGCEVGVLESSAGFLNSVGARLIVEPHLVDGALSTERCCELLRSAGYHVKIRSKMGESEALIEAVP